MEKLHHDLTKETERKTEELEKMQNSLINTFSTSNEELSQKKQANTKEEEKQKFRSETQRRHTPALDLNLDIKRQAQKSQDMVLRSRSIKGYHDPAVQGRREEDDNWEIEEERQERDNVIFGQCPLLAKGPQVAGGEC